MPHSWEQKWKLEERLGKGGQGVTHVAKSVNDQSIRGALKYLKNNGDKQARGRMRREVANLQTLSSAGGSVPRVLDHNTEDFENHSVELYVVMDLIVGSTLTQYIETNGHLSIDTSIKFALSLCNTVRSAHTFPILHRDLKPDNIIVSDATASELIVVDYGLSFNVSNDDITETDETFRNRFLDFPETNTPNGDRRDTRSDVTAVCAILYYCLTGKVPGQLQDGSGTLPHLRPGVSVREIQNDGLVSHIEALLTRGFAPNLANRFQSVDELTSRLQEVAGSSGAPDESDPVRLGANLSLQLRARDRKTQLAEFSQHSKVLFKLIEQQVNALHDKLGRFQISRYGGGGFGGGLSIESWSQLPDGLDLVAMSPFPIMLQAEHHAYQNFLFHAVASRGEQCALLSLDVSLTTIQDLPRSAVDQPWKYVAWFDGATESIHGLVANSCNDWITSSMKELAKKILGSEET